jgi:hypothetical protein
MEQGIVAQVTPTGIQVEDDFGDFVYVPTPYVTGAPRVGATCTLVRRLSESHSFRAFIEPPEERYPTTYERCDIEPEEKPERIASNPDESGIVFVGTGRFSNAGGFR